MVTQAPFLYNTRIHDWSHRFAFPFWNAMIAKVGQCDVY